jgi:hypothetical protein
MIIEIWYLVKHQENKFTRGTIVPESGFGK